jgi:ABC-2 type transport system ATP-binding protein
MPSRALRAPDPAPASRVAAPPPSVSASAPAAVDVRDLHRRFRGHMALRGVSLSIPAGVPFGLLGPHGSGKTTLLRTIAGVLRPTRGAVSILGARPGHPPAHLIGYMPQRIAMSPRVTVYETMRCFAGLQHAGDRQHIDRALDAVGLLDHKHRVVQELSEGTLRRVSLACAIAHEPLLLLLDEPTAGVDPAMRAAFWEHFRALNAAGVTVVVATHAMDEAELCDQLAVLREGELIAAGAPGAIRERYAAATMEHAFLRITGGAR